MPSSNVFHWLDGRGWLIFSGDADDDIRALALGRAAADGAVACISLSGDPDQLLDDISDLGAPSGYLVDVLGEDDQTLRDKLAQAGMVIITGGESPLDVRGALYGVALEGIQAAYQNGAIILLENFAATAFSTWIMDEEIEDGLKWLDGAAVFMDGSAAEQAKPIFAEHPEAVAVAIQPGSALAFGPDGEIQAWGRREVT
ncbi:MAG TPA: hypothetical protein VHD90_08910, partial [Phototrophicaceae bacterium]|nr:hypothetical protein [Phototrophicaceae bacterium]